MARKLRNDIWGSPPRMRGKAHLVWMAFDLGGITPAHAGKRKGISFPASMVKDHPRACGEKAFTKMFCASIRGSPPRMRGKGGVIRYTNFVHGITPAHAGKSATHCFWRQVDRDHPRACGEKTKKVYGKEGKEGSPPRMRGKARSHAHAHHERRITPAHAGKRQRRNRQVGALEDHPRACGEKYACFGVVSCITGSPPRMRGKVRAGWFSRRGHGITPAHAGKSTSPSPKTA